MPLSRLPLQRAEGRAGADTEHGPGLNMHQLAEGNAPSASAEIQRAVMMGTASLPPLRPHTDTLGAAAVPMAAAHIGAKGLSARRGGCYVGRRVILLLHKPSALRAGT